MDSSERTGPLQLAVRFLTEPSVASAYATNMLVQSTAHEFVITFFEAQPPMIVGATAEERRAVAARLTHVDARPVARVIVSAGRMAAFVDLLQRQVTEREKLVVGDGHSIAAEKR